MVHSNSNRSELILVTRHRGFIRMALQLGTALVPVLSFGETQILENVSLPSIQRWSLKNLGVGFPLIPYGKFYSPVPNNVPVTVVVGKAIEVKKIDEPTAQQIEALHNRYYEEIKRLFEAHKEAAGYPDCRIIFTED
jgi:hypothetical protein